ncbi:hypothetical protein ACFL1S_00875 [Pseudomonadota bacterium]
MRSPVKFALVHLGDAKFLELKRDIILGLYHTLRALGHDVFISHNMLDKSRLNLLVGLDITSPDVRTKLRNSGIAYWVYETEIIHAGQLNFRPHALMDLQQDYLPTLAKAQRILSPFRQVVQTLKDLDIDANYARWGYVPELTEVETRAPGEKGIDGYFFGIMTPTRKFAVQSLRQAGLKIKTSDYPGVPAYLRHHYMSRSKLILSLKHSENWQTINPYRIMHALQNHCCPVVESQHQDQDGYGQYAVMPSQDKFTVSCVEMIRSGSYQPMFEEKLARLREEPMTEVFKALL